MDIESFDLATATPIHRMRCEGHLHVIFLAKDVASAAMVKVTEATDAQAYEVQAVLPIARTSTMTGREVSTEIACTLFQLQMQIML